MGGQGMVSLIPGVWAAYTEMSVCGAEWQHSEQHKKKQQALPLFYSTAELQSIFSCD